MSTSVSTPKLYAGANILSVVLALVLNYLAVSLPLNNRTTGELSDMYPNFFVPAGFTFSIWGVIYLLLLVFMIYQAAGVARSHVATTAIVTAIGPWFFFSGVANAAWIIAWHYEAVVISVLIMLFLLYSLIRIYLAVADLGDTGLWDKLMIRVPFSVYLGWISVATIANFTTLFVSMGWQTGGHVWAVIMVIIATLLAIIMVFVRQDVFYMAVIIWALFGIYSKQAGSSQDGASSVAVVAKYAMTLLTVFAVLIVIGKKTYFSPRGPEAKEKA